MIDFEVWDSDNCVRFAVLPRAYLWSGGQLGFIRSAVRFRPAPHIFFFAGALRVCCTVDVLNGVYVSIFEMYSCALLVTRAAK